MARFILTIGLVSLFRLGLLSYASPVPLERSKRQDLSAILGLLNQGGSQAGSSGQGSSNPILDYVKGYAVKKVLGDGAMGQLIGSSLGFGSAFATTTAAPGFFDRLFGKATTLPPPTTTTQAEPGFWKKLFGGATTTTETTTTTTTTTTPKPGIWNRILSFGKGATSQPVVPDSEPTSIKRDVNDASGSSSNFQNLSPATESPGFFSAIANRIRGGTIH